jgi:hypothetical protein
MKNSGWPFLSSRKVNGLIKFILKSVTAKMSYQDGILSGILNFSLKSSCFSKGSTAAGGHMPLSNNAEYQYTCA